MGITTDPNDPGLGKRTKSGQNESYLVLSEAERAKGYMRPYRDSYVHVGRSICGKPYETEEHSTLLCASEPSHEGECGPVYQSQLPKPGCGVKTTMGRAISETYARDPKFYGATFCCGCGKHLPVDEFVWDGTDQVVGS